MPSEIKNSTSFPRRLIDIILILFSAAASAAPLTPASSPHGLVVAAATASKPASSRASQCGNCGQIESVREIGANAQSRGAPTVGGAMGGAGNQIGPGGGQDLAITGGHHIEKKAASQKYEIVVRLDDGSTRTIQANHTPLWRAGDRVSVNNGAIQSAQ